MMKSAAILVLLLLLAWFGGELLHLDRTTRVAAVTVLIAAAVAAIAVQKVLALRSARLIEKKLRSQAEEQVRAARPDQRPEVQAVREQLDEAIHALKTSRLGKSALAALPWYVIIGPPGSGKSTALKESGLNFPYVSPNSKGVRGVGGTRNCDWWFTDEAILLDTAGRYTTELDDRPEWLAFLDLLRKARPRKPIHGALVAVGIPDLLAATDAEREAHAKNIRERIDELTTRLETVFPVYLLFTKCDLIQGFVEFFEDFSRTDRGQVWGCSLAAGAAPREAFEVESARLFRSLASQRLTSLSGERPSSKKENIFLFPLQFQAAVAKMADFVELLFRPNPYQESSPFRGFYFTSGTQEGTPLDQVLRSMSAAFGLPAEAVPAAVPAEKKAYFIHQLFTKVIFPDRTLARTSERVARRLRTLRLGTLAGSAVATLTLLLAFSISFFGNRSLLHSAETAAAKVRESESPQALEDLRLQVEALDQSPPLRLRWGLYRGDAIHPAVRKVYFDALRRRFLVPCGERLRTEMVSLDRKVEKSKDDHDRLKKIHLAYAILGGILPGSEDRSLLERVLPREGGWTADAHLQTFLARLDRAADWKIAADEELVRDITNRQALALWPLRAYEDLVADGGRVLGKMNIDAGPLIGFTVELPEVFTNRGWDDYVRHAIHAQAEGLEAEYRKRAIAQTADQVETRIREMHRDRRARKWSEFVQGIRLLPFPDLEEASRRLRILSGDGSPFPALVARISEEQSKSAPEAKTLADARHAIEVFQETVENFVRTTRPGSRFLGRKFDGLTAAFAEASRSLDKASRTVPLMELFRPCLENTRLALAAEAASEAEEVWKRTVVPVFRDSLAGRYPFDDRAPVAAGLADVSRLFNPKSGAFWKVLEDVQALQAVTIDGRPTLTFSRDFKDSVDRARTIAKALFPAGGETIAVPFRIRLQQREAVDRVHFRLGSTEFKHTDSPDGSALFTWKEGEPGGARIRIDVATVARAQEREFKEDWGLLRLVEAGNPVVTGERTLALSYEWKVDTALGVRSCYGDAELTPAEPIHPFQKGLFAGFRVPETIIAPR